MVFTTQKNRHDIVVVPVFCFKKCCVGKCGDYALVSKSVVILHKLFVLDNFHA